MAAWCRPGCSSLPRKRCPPRIRVDFVSSSGTIEVASLLQNIAISEAVRRAKERAHPGSRCFCHETVRLADRNKAPRRRRERKDVCRSAGRFSGRQSPGGSIHRPGWCTRDVDVVAEWRIVNSRWYEIFAKAGLTKVFKILIKLDEQAREVRAFDQEWSVEWRAGVPTLSLAAKAFRGQTREFSFGTAFAFTQQGVLARFTATSSRPRKSKHLCRMP